MEDSHSNFYWMVGRKDPTELIEEPILLRLLQINHYNKNKAFDKLMQLTTDYTPICAREASLWCINEYNEGLIHVDHATTQQQFVVAAEKTFQKEKKWQGLNQIPPSV